MINGISLLMVILYIISFGLSQKLKKFKLDSPYASCIPMFLSMTSSVTIGLLLAVWFPGFFALMTVLAIILSAALAVFSGKDFGVKGIMEAQASSLMGAMMGTMLGVMLTGIEAILMILAMDFLFLISVYFVLLLLTKDTVTSNPAAFKGKLKVFSAFFIMNIILISTVGFAETMSSEQGELDTSIHNHSH